MEFTNIPRKFDELFAGFVQPNVTIPVILQTGNGVLKRGTVLGRVSQLPESDLYAGTPILVPVDSTATDGSQEPYAILADWEVDTTTRDRRAVAFTDGEFNRDALIFGGTDTVEMHEVAMRKAGMITKRIVK